MYILRSLNIEINLQNKLPSINVLRIWIILYDKPYIVM